MSDDPGKTRATYRALLFLLIIYCGAYWFVRTNDWLVVMPPVSDDYDGGYNDKIVPGDHVSFETGKNLQLAFYPLVYIEGYLQENYLDTDKRK